MQLAAVEVLHQSSRQHAVPALQGRQLLRSLAQRFEEGRDLAASAFYPRRLGMRMADGDPGLTGMALTFHVTN